MPFLNVLTPYYPTLDESFKVLMWPLQIGKAGIEFLTNVKTLRGANEETQAPARNEYRIMKIRCYIYTIASHINSSKYKTFSTDMAGRTAIARIKYDDTLCPAKYSMA